MKKIAPSIVSAPMINLGAVLRSLEDGGADLLHFDLEDGAFVPVMNLGSKIIRDLRPYTRLPFDVHLMMANPEWIISELAGYGVSRVAVHYEACSYPRRTLGLINAYGMQAGLAFNPATPIPSLNFCLPFLSFVIVLTTEPEAEPCSYLPDILDKVREGKRQKGLSQVEWVVDGGITAENACEAWAAGADVVVSGRGIFADGNIAENIRKLRGNNESMGFKEEEPVDD